MGGPPGRATGAHLGHPRHQHQAGGRGCGARSHRAPLEPTRLREEGGRRSEVRRIRGAIPGGAATQNKPSTQQDKASILTHHLTPAFGRKRLIDISYAAIQDYASKKAQKLAKKTVNNHLTVLRRLLVVAKKRGVIQSVPEIEWLKAPDPEFDFLDFEEADRLVAGADGE